VGQRLATNTFARWLDAEPAFLPLHRSYIGERSNHSTFCERTGYWTKERIPLLHWLLSVYSPQENPMTTVTTRKEQSATASAAKKVGGYSELVRLSAARALQGKNSSVVRDTKTGRWDVKAAAKRG